MALFADRRRALGALAVLALATLAPQTGAAQDASAEIPSPDEAPQIPQPDPGVDAAPEAPATADPIVHAILVEAVAEYDASHWAEAQALFRRANELAPSGRTLRGLGMASFELRQYATAIRALEQALAATERSLTDTQRAHVEELLARARGFVAHVRAALTPEAASLRIDGVVATHETDGSVLVDPGRHLVVIAHDGYEAETIDLSLEPGVLRELTVALRPVVVASSPAPAPNDDLLWAGAGLGVAAAVALAASAVTGIIALVDRDRLSSDCHSFVCPESSRATRDRARELSIATDVIGTAAAVLGATGLALLLAGSATRGGAVEGGAACTDQGCVVVVGGRF